MKKIRMIVSDLDGTLLDEHHRLSDDVAESIKAFVSQGGFFTIATGRNMFATRSIYDSLELKFPMILSNGAVISDTNEIMYQSGIQLSELKDLLNEASRTSLAILIFEHNRIYGFGNKKGIDRFFNKEKVTSELINPEIALSHQESVQKVVLVGDFNISKNLWEKHLMDENENLSFMQSEADFFEIIKNGENKGNAMLMLAKTVGIEKDEILAIGNHMNDKEMIQEAGIGAVVANCYDELRQYADYVCENSFGKGVKEVIEKFG